MKKVAIYIRVSTTEQEKEGYSIPAQKEKMIAYCKAKDWLVQDMYVDGGYTGSNTDRPALNRLLGSLKDIDIVLVYKLDRLSRSQKDTLYLIEDEFISANVDFVSITENFDTTSPFGRAMIGILSVFAQLERENIKERSTMGRIERAKKGLWAGAPNPPIGYDLIDSNLVVNEYEAMQVKEVFNLYLKGYGTQRIQNAFKNKGYTTKYGDWENVSTHTVYRIIQNRTYIGEISYAKKWYKGIHTPIIDADIFDKANEYHARRKGNSRSLRHFLSGLIFCKECGAKYISDSKNNNSYYVCENRKKGYKQDFKCMNTIFKTNELEGMAINQLKTLVEDREGTLKNMYKDISPNDKEDNNDVIKERILEIDKQIERLMDLYQLDTIPVEQLSNRIQKLSEEKKSISQEIVEKPIAIQVNIGEILDTLKDFDVVWEDLEVDQKKEITAALLGIKLIVTSKGI